MSVDLFDSLIDMKTRCCAVVLAFLLSCDAGVTTGIAQQAEAPKVQGAGESTTPRSTVTKSPIKKTALVPAGASRTGLLTLIDGSQVPGRLQGSNTPGVIHWVGHGFSTPFHFATEAVESIKFPKLTLPPDGLSSDEFAIEFTNRDIVYGNIVSWGSGFLTVSTQSFGDLKVPTDAITRLYRVQENETLLFARFNGLQSWNTTQWETKGWQEAGNYLSTQKRGAVLNGDLGVPPRSVIELTLSWKDQADFAISLGSDVTATQDLPIDGWRLETAGQKLIAVRESKESANLTMVADLSLRRDLRLTFYLDQTAGKMHVMRKDGKRLATLLMPTAPAPAQKDVNAPANQIEPDGTKPAAQRGIRIVNRGAQLTVERISIARWLGDLPDASADADALVAFDDGTFASGSIESLESGQLSIGQITPQSKFDWNRVTGITFRKPNPPPEPAQCALFLQNGIRISGSLVAFDAGTCTLASANSSSPTRIPRNDIRSLIIFSHEPKPPEVATNGEIKGQLQLGELKLAGVLAPSDSVSAEAEKMVFQWKPYGSAVAAKMNTNVAGNVVYRNALKPNPKSPQAQAQALQRLRIKQQQRGLNFGELFLKRADEVKTPKVERDAHVVHVRTGDIISCRVDRIDATGVHVSTIDSKDGFVSHEEIKAIEYVTNAPPPDLEAAKRERLLTIPRLQKSAPPTHLLCSHSGDFLRCRLIDANADQVRAEVQLTEIVLPRNRIAQIIWLHPEEIDNTKTDKDAATEPADQRITSIYDGLAQVLLRDGKRVTFKPTQSTQTHISGESAIIGPCRFALDTVDQLIMGKQILTEVTDIAYNRWKLQAAIEPLVTAAMEQGNDASTAASPLIGQPAPEISLRLLDGTPFKLSDQKGKIVVLDFWATWCAPCMQTMPLVEQAMEQFDAEQVRLISVNLQESVQQIQPVLERYKLDVTVALDIDGVAAARYEARAIPQLVIVGNDGIVKQLYVGGGPKVVNQMSASIQNMLDETSE